MKNATRKISLEIEDNIMTLSTGINNPQDLQKALVISQVFA